MLEKKETYVWKYLNCGCRARWFPCMHACMRRLTCIVVEYSPVRSGFVRVGFFGGVHPIDRIIPVASS